MYALVFFNTRTTKAVHIRPPFRTSLCSRVLMFLSILLCLLFQAKSDVVKIESKCHRGLPGTSFGIQTLLVEIFIHPTTGIDIKPARLSSRLFRTHQTLLTEIKPPVLPSRLHVRSFQTRPTHLVGI